MIRIRYAVLIFLHILTTTVYAYDNKQSHPQLTDLAIDNSKNIRPFLNVITNEFQPILKACVAEEASSLPRRRVDRSFCLTQTYG
jgi:hypothetical protein